MCGLLQEGPMHPIRIEEPSAEQHAELDRAYRTAKDGRIDAHVGPLRPETSSGPAMQDEHPPSEGKGSRELLRLERFSLGLEG